MPESGAESAQSIISGNNRRIFIGTVLILISNLAYIGNNYLVAWTGLLAPEIALFRGVVQCLVFGSLVLRNKSKKKEPKDGSNLKDQEKIGKWKKILLLAAYGFFVSTMSFTFLAAIPFMPVGDLIVISFMSPVFSVFLDRIVLKRPLTFLSVFLCVVIIVGDVLVVKPPILFGNEQNEQTDENNNRTGISKLILIHSSNYLTKDKESAPSKEHDKMYFMGVALCLYAAIAGSVTNVLAIKCRMLRVSSSFLMLISGASSLVLSLVSSPILSNRLITSPLSLSSTAAGMLPVISVLTILAYWSITIALSITRNPTLISMLRSTEILISLVTEAIYWQQKPGVLSISGSILVSMCVLAMAGHDKIMVLVTKQFKWRQSEASLISDKI